MKKIKSFFSICFTFFCLLSLVGCDSLFGNDNVVKYDDELTYSTGKWVLKYNGTFRAIYKGLGEDVLTPLTYIFTRNDKDKEDWLSCYVEEFYGEYTQFTLMQIEEDLGFIDGTVYTHTYRISELPYKLGSYILEGNDYKEETNNYSHADEFYIPSGTYSLESGESFTFMTIKPRSNELFQYKNKDTIIEGTYTISSDKKTIYLYIEHEAYSKVTKADKEFIDTTVSIYYPPDFYLRGDFSNSNQIVINDLYHHSYSTTKIEDSIWTFGTYIKI